MKWETVKLGECCEVTSSKRIFYSEYVTDGVPFYRSKEIIERNHGQSISEPLFIRREKYDEINKRFGVPQEGDLLLTSVGTIGVPYIIQSSDHFYFKDGNLTWCRNFKNRLSSKFLYYWIISNNGQGVLNNATIGSSQRALTIAALKNIAISLPDISTQIKIVGILSVYDDLIENNRQQIKLLEEAAQRLYKEWFVDLHFPGYEDMPVVDGVPKGWERNRADSFFSISIGKTPPRAEKQWFVRGNDGIPWLSISDMGSTDSFAFATSEALTEEAVNKFHVKVVTPGTVFVSFKLTVGRVAIATMDMCTNEAIAHFHIEDAFMRAYTYCYLCNFEYDTLGSTSSISKAVNSKIIKSMPFVMPRREVVLAFSKQVDPLLDMIKNKQLDCIKLQEARDRLLPKLMSGELEV